jgi:hypothetical protein
MKVGPGQLTSGSGVRAAIGLAAALIAIVFGFQFADTASATMPRLGRAPKNCNGLTNDPMGQPPGFRGRWLGATPVWALFYTRLNAATRTFRPATELRYYHRERYGWPVKALWEVLSEGETRVTVSVREKTGSSVWVHLGGVFNQTTRSPVLDPAYPGHPYNQNPATKEWGSVIYFPRAGCYTLDLQWKGGGWRYVFGFGR